MRRVQSIALVHETLSVSIDESVDFDEVVDRLLAMLSDVMGTADRVTVRPRGQPRRRCRPSWRRALVLVLTELVQNAIEHAFPDDRDGHGDGRRRPRAGANCGCWCATTGSGCPTAFTATGSERLGLQIVQHAGRRRAGRHGQLPAPTRPAGRSQRS